MGRGAAEHGMRSMYQFLNAIHELVDFVEEELQEDDMDD